MNKKLLILLPVLSLMLAACTNSGKKDDKKGDDSGDVVAVEKVTLNETSLTMDPDEVFDLKAVVTPATLTERGVTWSSDTQSVATVSEGGRVTAIAEGTAKIKATAKADNTKFAECTVTVNKRMVIAAADLTSALAEGKSFKLGTYQENTKSYYYFTGSVDKDTRGVTDASWEKGVDVKLASAGAALEGKYVLTFQLEGAKKYFEMTDDHHYRIADTATLLWDWDAELETVTRTINGTTYFPGTYSNYTTISGCDVSMVASDFIFQLLFKTEPVDPTTITVKSGNDFVYAGGTLQMSAKLGPAGAVGSVTWSVTGDEKVTIDQNGLLTAAEDATIDGEVVVKAAFSETVFGTKTITVKEKLNYGTKDAPITTAEARTLIDKLGKPNPSDEKAYIKGVVASNTAQVAATETSKARFQEIWLTDADGSNNKYFEFYAVVPDEGVDVSGYTAANSLVGKEVTVYAKLAYYSGTYETSSPEIKVNGQSQNPKVYDSGLIVAIADGTRRAASVTLSPAADFEMEQGEEKTLSASILPYGSIDSIAWSKSGDGADKVTLENGKVTVAEDAVPGTTVTITATAREGVAASVTITLKKQAVAYTKLELDVFANSFTGDDNTGTFTSGIATLTLDKNTSSSNNRYSDADHLRVYKNAKLTVGISSGTLGKVDMTFTAESYAAVELTLSTGATMEVAGTVGTVTLPADATSFSFVASGGQVRINKVVLFYVPAAQ